MERLADREDRLADVARQADQREAEDARGGGLREGLGEGGQADDRGDGQQDVLAQERREEVEAERARLDGGQGPDERVETGAGQGDQGQLDERDPGEIDRWHKSSSYAATSGWLLT